MLSLLSALTLSACGNTNNPVSESESEPISEVESESESTSSETESEVESESESEEQTEFDGFTRIEEPTLVYDEFNNVASHQGDAKLLIIPINLYSDNPNFHVLEWTGTSQQKVNNFFFGNSEDLYDKWESVKTYFEKVSKNKLNVDGMMTDIYQVESPYSIKYILENVKTDLDIIHQIFEDAVEWVKETYTDVDWTEYDQNKDGYIDNLHFITNATFGTSNLRADSGTSPFWPHSWNILQEKGNLESPLPNTYETTCLGHLEKTAKTLIHEQGHVFGIDDYYDYSYVEPTVNYVGTFDMQSNNCGDWNAFSKFSVGWADAYYFNGSQDTATIKIKSSALTNQCIVVPANPDTFNGSAFDEYFLIELFTADGVNALDWAANVSDRVNYGVRLYHVNANLYHRTSQTTGIFIEDLNDAKEIYSLGGWVRTGANNSVNCFDYDGVDVSSDFKLLSLIQKGGADTFGTGARSQINETDLFYTGDLFTFDNYSHFLSKSGQIRTTMDNGETFPYYISFDYVCREYAEITIGRF